MERDAKLIDSDKKPPKRSAPTEEVKNNRKIDQYFKVIGEGEGNE
jgi:hypothetical protein